MGDARLGCHVVFSGCLLAGSDSARFRKAQWNGTTASRVSVAQKLITCARAVNRLDANSIGFFSPPSRTGFEWRDRRCRRARPDACRNRPARRRSGDPRAVAESSPGTCMPAPASASRLPAPATAGPSARSRSCARKPGNKAIPAGAASAPAPPRHRAVGPRTRGRSVRRRRRRSLARRGEERRAAAGAATAAVCGRTPARPSPRLGGPAPAAPVSQPPLRFPTVRRTSSPVAGVRRTRTRGPVRALRADRSAGRRAAMAVAVRRPRRRAHRSGDADQQGGGRTPAPSDQSSSPVAGVRRTGARGPVRALRADPGAARRAAMAVAVRRPRQRARRSGDADQEGGRRTPAPSDQSSSLSISSA
jgi:hypothetical protein